MPDLVELVRGKDDGSSMSNPGAKALKAGDRKTGLEDGSQSIAYSITVIPQPMLAGRLRRRPDRLAHWSST